MQKMNPRHLACEILYQVIHQGGFSNKLMQTLVDQSTMSDVDKRFVRTLVYGVLEKSMTLDWWLEQLSSIKVKKIEPKTQLLIKLGLYQIAFLEKVPNSAAVDESVKLTKKINFRSSGFVNGILRSFIRLEGNWPYPDAKKDKRLYLSVYYSHPMWLVSHWMETYGEAQTIALLEADNQVPKISIRCNTLKTTIEKLSEALEADGYVLKRHELLPEALIIESFGQTPINQLEVFKQGHFFVQDLSAMLVGRVAEPKPNELILDMCAAPGGKTTHLAELMGNEGQVISRDVTSFKTKQIEENLDRMGITCVSLEVADALIFNTSDIEKYDKIILDAPCSGLGIIRRKPEIRYNRKFEDISALAQIQKDMLKLAAQYVKKGGALIYSTCTIDPLENDLVIDWFLENHPAFSIAPMPKTLETLAGETNRIKLYQSVEGFDGFYIVKLYHSN